MCILPDTATKLFVLVAIAITAGVHIVEIVFCVHGMKLSQAPLPLIYLCMSACVLLLIGLVLGFYGTIVSKIPLLQVMMFIIVVSIVVKLFIWIIIFIRPKNYGIVVNDVFIGGLACSVICFITAMIHYLRLRLNLYQIE